MPAIDKHAAVLKALLGLKPDPVEKVWVLARLNNPELLGGASRATAYVFLPDLHLVSRAAAARYKYGFTKMGDGSTVAREELLEQLCRSLLKVRRRLGGLRKLVTVQLGDFLDLWREDHLDGQDVQSMVRTILHDHPVAQNRLVAQGAGSLSPRILAGNHEKWGADGTFASIALARARLAHLLPVASRRSVLATHGDLFDPLERLVPDRIQSWLVRRFSTLAAMNTYDADRGAGGAEPGGLGGYEGGPPRELTDLDQGNALPDWINVWQTRAGVADGELKNSHELLPLALKSAAGLRAGRAGSLREMGLDNHGPLTDLRTIVVGHSHIPRLCVHLDGTRPERNLVLADCGAWIEAVRIGGREVPSCQLGVLCGGDLRIYQLDMTRPA